MKKFIAIIAAVLAVALGAFAQPRIIKHVPQSFLYGQNVVISNNVTVLFSGTNLYMVVPYGTFYTNINSSVTNAVNTNVFNPSWNTTVFAYPDYNGNVNSNLSISISVNSTNIVQSSRQLATTNLLANVIVPTVSSTNTLTFLFDRTVDGVNYGTTAQDQFSVAIAGPGVTPSTITTNVPTSFLVGAQKIRLKSIVSSTASGSPGCVLNNVSLGGFPP